MVQTAIPVSKANDKEITLPSGRKAVMGEFLGEHVMEAQRVAEGDQGKMMAAMMATIITVDGKKLVMEDFVKMPGGDYLMLMKEFAEVNF